MYAPFESAIDNASSQNINARSEFLEQGNSVTRVSIDRFDSRELHRVPPRMKTIARGVSHVCCADIYYMIDDEIKAALLYALIFDIALITL